MGRITLLITLVACIAFVWCSKDGNSHDDIFDINKKMFERAKKGVTGFTAGKDKKVEEMHEGDIVLTPKLEKFLNNQRDGKDISPFDAAVRSAWPNARVPYTFRRDFPRLGRNAVAAAIAEYNAKTCIKFVPRRSSDRSYIEFFQGGGCYSMIGRQGGKQQVSLGRGCETKGVAIHEMMHALGFFHEQSRRDRDQYIRIMWNNIPGRVRYNFEKYRHGQADTLNEPYDKQSVMHYGNYAFSNNRQRTIVSLSNPRETLGQRNGLSRIDIRQLKKMYKCSGVTTTTRPVNPRPSSCKDKYTLCPTLARERFCTVSVSSWVRTNCKKSCGGCAKKCQAHSLSGNCKGWAKRGFCQGKYQAFMEKTCSQCKKCQ